MLTIILGIILAVLFLLFSESVNSRDLKQLFSVIARTVLMVAVFYGLFSPLSGYEEWRLVEETSMTALEENIDSDQIQIEGIHDSSKVPVVKVYERKGIKSIWTFAIGTKETRYVFSMTEGTGMIEVKLN